MGKLWQFTTNSRGQVTGRTDPLGRQVSIGYAGNGDIASRTDETGAVTGFEHDPAGRLTATVDPLGHRIEATNTTWGEVATSTRASGGVSTVAYNHDRQRVSVTDSVGGVTRYEYDAAGRTAAVVDAVGGRTTVAYDPMGRPTTVTSPGEASIVSVYSAEGWPISVTDALGAGTATSYDPAGRPIRVTDALGQVVQTGYTRAGRVAKVQTPDGATRAYAYDAAGHASAYFGAGPATNDTWTATYDAAGRVSVTADPFNHQRRTTYDDAGRIATVTDPVGVVRTYSYSDTARTVTVTDPLGIVSVQTSDTAGRIVADADGSGAVTTYGYDAEGQVTTITDPDGVVTGYEYDPAGRLRSVTDPAGRRTAYTLDPLGRVTDRDLPGPAGDSFGYDVAGNQTSYTDPAGHEWTATYDALGRVVTQTDPLGHSTSHDRDLLGRVVSTTDPTGVVTTTGYDPVGRVAVEADSTGASWQTSYDGEGHVTSTVDPVGVTWTYTFDRAGRLTDAISDAGERHYQFLYDAADRLATSEAPYELNYGYDARGRMSTQTDALNHTTIFGYDGAGRQTTLTLPSGHTSTTAYTPGGRIRSATDGTGNTSNYGYDSAGQLTRVTLPRGGHYDYTYDDAGRLATESDPLGRTTTFDYDAAGRSVSTLYPSGRLIEFTYDAAGRLITSAAGGQTRTYGYDDAGRITAATAPAGALGFGYDARGLQVRSTDSRGDTTFEYDAAHRLTRRVPAVGTATVYGYDPESGDLATVRGPMNIDVDRGLGGRINRLRGTSPSSSAVKETYSYNAAGQLTSTSAGITPASQVTYDIDGQVASHSQNHSANPASNTTDFAYDNAGRLTTAVLKHGTTVVSTSTYGWDADGNRTSVAMTGQPAVTTDFDPADRPTTSSDGTAYVHDLDGNLISTTNAGATTTFTYNAFNELVETSAAGTTVAYTRDALGRVTRRTQTSAVDRFTYYDGTSTLVGGVRTGSGPVSDAIRMPDNGKLLALAGPGATTLRLQSTVHGDVSGLWNGTTGASLSTTVYDPFGVPTTSGTNSVGLGWQTMLTDPTNGLVDMAFRHYQPTSGRFTAPDNLIGDLTLPVTLNRYLYANASPANYFDPDGHCASRSDLGYLRWWWCEWNEGFYDNEPDVGATRFLKGFVKGARDNIVGGLQLATATVKCSKHDQATCDDLDKLISPNTIRQIWGDFRHDLGDLFSDKFLETAGAMLGSILTGRFFGRLNDIVKPTPDIPNLPDIDLPGTRTPDLTPDSPTAGHPNQPTKPNPPTPATDKISTADHPHPADGRTAKTDHSHCLSAEFCQLPLFVFKDGEASSAAGRASSVGGGTAFQPVPASLRNQMIQAHIDAAPAGETTIFTCWRCGHRTTNPANVHVGHINTPRVSGGNHDPANLCFEGAACNLSAQNRGSVTPGMSCAERGSCGAPYGRYD